MRQKFGKGDLAILRDPDIFWKVRIVECILDEDGSWWYEVEPIEFNGITREVPQERLSYIG